MEKLRCENGEWKMRAFFSNRQLDKYEQEARKGRAKPSKTGIRCIEHANTQVLELKCKGPCGRVRDLRLFSKSTRRNGKNWCVDCTDWQIKTENGETLPPPCAVLSAEEQVQPGLPQPGLLRDDMLYGADAFRGSNIDDAASSVSGDDTSTISDMTTTLSLSVAQSSVLNNNTNAQTTTNGNRSNQSSSQQQLKYVPERAPHWLLPDLDGPLVLTGSAGVGAPVTPGTPVTAAETTSTTGTQTTTATSSRVSQAVSFNAWGPNGEFARHVKNPTVVSADTASTATTTQQEEVKVSKSGWVKIPGRKQPPQLPDYLKYDIVPDDDEGDYDDGSDDGTIRWL